jgi:hypothetical protein
MAPMRLAGEIISLYYEFIESLILTFFEQMAGQKDLFLLARIHSDKCQLVVPLSLLEKMAHLREVRTRE